MASFSKNFWYWSFWNKRFCGDLRGTETGAFIRATSGLSFESGSKIVGTGFSFLRQGSGNEGLPMGQSGEKLSRPKYVMLYLFLGQNFPQNPFLKSKMPPEVSFSISHFSIHFFLYKIWQFCSIFVEKKLIFQNFQF